MTRIVTALGVGLALGGASLAVAPLWGGGEGKAAVPEPALRLSMTAAEAARENGLGAEEGAKALRLPPGYPPDAPLSSLGRREDELRSGLRRALALKAEHSSRNWLKIPLKFLLWAAALALAFAALRRKAMTGRRRLFHLGGAVLLFGVALGSDPNPMGTVKDALVLLGAEGVVFPPRLVALVLFLLLGILANRLLCGWGCHLGTLQDLLFHLRRRGAAPWRLPFVLTNSVRAVVFLGLAAAALLGPFDLLGPIDPFRLFDPARLTLAGVIVLTALLLLSPFLYRPWCHLLCPFGLLAWGCERFSWRRVAVDRSTCIACRKCERSCPSTVMSAILRHDRLVTPDCYACGACLAACPTGSVSFGKGRRTPPPVGIFPPRGEEMDG